MTTVYEANLTRAYDLMVEHLNHMSICANVRYPDITLLMAKNGIVLSQSAMTELAKRLVDNGQLIRLTKQRMIKPLPAPVGVKTDLNTEQRLAILEAGFRDLTTQVAALSNRLI